MSARGFLCIILGFVVVLSFTLAFFLKDATIWVMVIGINVGVVIGVPIGGCFETMRMQEKFFNE